MLIHQFEIPIPEEIGDELHLKISRTKKGLSVEVNSKTATPDLFEPPATVAKSATVQPDDEITKFRNQLKAEMAKKA